MKKGKPEKVKWHNYRTNLSFPSDSKKPVDCGAWALHILTGKSIKEIKKLSKDNHWPTQTMLSYLRKNGFDVIPVTLGNVVEAHSIRGPGKYVIDYNNVLLIDHEAYKEQSSWCVIHKNLISHSGETKSLNPLHFINYPINAVYLIWHKKWNLQKSLT